MKKPLKYFSCLCEKDENSIVKQAFLISKQLDMKNKKSYISELKTYLRETGCYDSDTSGFMRTKYNTSYNKEFRKQLRNFLAKQSSSEKLVFIAFISKDSIQVII